MRRAQQCRYFARSLPPRKRHSRLTIVRRGCKRSRLAGIHGEAMYTAPTLRSACSSSSYRLPMCGVKGQGPLRSLGGPRGIFSHVREYPPYPQPHTVWGKAAASSGCSPLRAMRGKREDFSFEKPSLFTYFLLCRSNYSASCIAFAAVTAFACASAEHCS